MPDLSLEQLAPQHLNAGLWATSVLACLAREEQLDRRPRALEQQAKRLGCPTQFARANLHQIKPHHWAGDT